MENKTKNYCITYMTKRGAGVLMTTNDVQFASKRMEWCYKQRINATVRIDGIIVGRVWEDDTQRLGWNWYLECE